ncbi:MAG: hypothetical protein RIF46_16580 [Cyclobacteriaceae bacterium]
MENKKLDRFFQEKLARHETTPSNEAWNQISAELKGKKRPVVWMRVAAAILILAVSAVAVIQLNDNSTTTGEVVYINPDHPVKIETPVFELPVFEKVETVPVEKKTTPARNQKSARQFAAVEKTSEPETIELLDAPEIHPIESMALIEMPEPEIIEEVDEAALLPQLSVQITYIASSQPEPDTLKTDDKTKMGKLIAKAREISPGDMIASIRETKNNFFNGINN